jgi:hypothetical protein
MKKATVLKVVNVALAILFVNQAATGLLHDELSHETFELLHQNAAFVLVAAAVLHVALNWNWVRGLFAKRRTTSS